MLSAWIAGIYRCIIVQRENLREVEVEICQGGTIVEEMLPLEGALGVYESRPICVVEACPLEIESRPTAVQSDAPGNAPRVIPADDFISFFCHVDSTL